MPIFEENFDKFTAELKSKMMQGYNTYGDATFSREPSELVQEIRQELLDIIGWSYILLERMRGIENAIKRNL